MLAIRLQRTGRKGHAMFRMVVQDARRTPTSGKVVTYLGSYDPHTKTAAIDHEKASYYLERGAQPSPRAITLLKAEKIKMPAWVGEASPKQRAVRNPDKRRSTAPKTEEPKPEPAQETPASETVSEPAAEAPVEAPVEEA